MFTFECLIFGLFSLFCLAAGIEWLIRRIGNE
jgi:hypothetical protein